MRKSGDLKEDIKSADGELKQHVVWDLLSNYLFSPKSPSIVSPSNITPTPSPLDTKQAGIHKYMWAYERIRSMPIPTTVSAGVHLMILHSGGGGGELFTPPTRLIWTMTSVLACGDLLCKNNRWRKANCVIGAMCFRSEVKIGSG